MFLLFLFFDIQGDKKVHNTDSTKAKFNYTREKITGINAESTNQNSKFRQIDESEMPNQQPLAYTYVLTQTS